MSKQDPPVPPPLSADEEVPPIVDADVQQAPSGGSSFSYRIYAQQVVQIFIRPSVASFDNAQGGANWQIVLIALAGWSLISGLLGTIGQKNPALVFLIALLSSLAGFAVAVAITYVAARLLGGTGDLLHQAYAIVVLILVPVYIISLVLLLIPGLGQILALILSLYAFYLIFLGTASVQHLSQLKAVIVLLILIGVTFALGYLIPGLGI
jgi:hypothetical protein